MRTIKKSIANGITLLFVFWGSTGYTQEAVTASGKDASGSGGIVNYSIGQIAYSFTSGTNGSINQGVQQPYEIISIGVKETALTISLSVYPNPITNSLTLEIENFNTENLTYQLIDIQGKLLESNTITSKQTQLSTTALPPAIYFIHIIKENKRIESFKIIKN